MCPSTLAVSSVALLALLLGPLPASAIDSIYVVRHVDRESPCAGGEEPPACWPRSSEVSLPLTPQGERRARSLARRLSKEAGATDVVAVYASHKVRTYLTARPLVEKHRLPIHVDGDFYTPSSETAEALIARIEETHPGPGAVLIVGHSETVGHLLTALGATSECHERLGLTTSSGYLSVSTGYKGLWKADSATGGCDGIRKLAPLLALP